MSGSVCYIPNCGKACATRCMLSKRPHLCNRACGTCCGRCNCVPPGTSGNYEACACYAEMTTRGNKKKCP
ncbi:putative gibberellin regulated protein [Helianthus debilis subsp. tardiflorus]